MENRNIQELKLRNTAKKNLTRRSINAAQYDFLVKVGITQDDIGFMSVLDVPVINKLTGNESKLDEYLTYVGEDTRKLREEVKAIKVDFENVVKEYKVLENKYERLNKEYQQIQEKGIGSYLSMLLGL